MPITKAGKGGPEFPKGVAGCVVIRGTVTITPVPPPVMVGGLLLDSAASVSSRRRRSGYGGLLLDSAAGVGHIKVFPGYGGLLLDSEADLQYGHQFPGYGGLLLDSEGTVKGSAWNPFKPTLSLLVNGGADDSVTLNRTAFDHWEGTSGTTGVTYKVDGGYPFNPQVMTAEDGTHGPDTETWVSFDQPTKAATWSWSSSWGFTGGSVVTVSL